MEASILGAPGERAQTLGGCRHVGWSAYPAAGIPRRLLVVLSEEGEAVCCVLLCKSPLCPLSERTPSSTRSAGCPALVLVGVHGPSSGLIPEQAALSPPYLPSLVQRGCGVRPGGGRWSSWHRWSSLIPPSGGTMPLVRGEEKPGGVGRSSDLSPPFSNRSGRLCGHGPRKTCAGSTCIWVHRLAGPLGC